MSLKERAYSVLVVSAAENFNAVLYDLLPKSKYPTIQTVSSVAAAKRASVERTFDFIIINAPLPDENGTRFAVDICMKSGTIVLLMVKSDIYEDVYDKVAEYGVFVLAKPTSRPTMTHALEWMASTKERLRKSEKKALSIEEKMEEIRIINRAKWLLIGELKMDESDAHRYIEKQAMDQCVSKRAIAETIIKMYS